MKPRPKIDKTPSRHFIISMFKYRTETIAGKADRWGYFRLPWQVPPRLLLIRWLTCFLAALSGLLFLACLSEEMRTSLFQSKLLAPIATKITYRIAKGPSSRPVQAPAGPYDQRLGYTRLPEFSARLQAQAYTIYAQAEVSDEMHQVVQKGIFPIFKEKSAAGLDIRDRSGQTVFAFSSPKRIFHAYDEIPPLIVEILLFIEDRKLLDSSAPFMNPAVNWTRVAKAFTEKASEFIMPGRPVSGGSTLATQIEKFRHSEDGRTHSMQEKSRQVLSASLRSYQEGGETLPVRRRIILDYINSVPLAAFPGYGEVSGLGDGLWVWYGVELNQVVDALKNDVASEMLSLDEKALRLKQVLSLFLAHKKPTFFLNGGKSELDGRCKAFLKLLASENIITAELAGAAEKIPLAFRDTPVPYPVATWVDRKASNPVRLKLNALLGNERLYDLDRLDLLAKSSLDVSAQKRTTEILTKLKDPKFVAGQGLQQARLLESGDPANVVYAFTLYERTAEGNMLRVQTDSSDQMLNFNEGVMLDLGSSAKLRTLISYLEIITDLYHQYSLSNTHDLGQIRTAPQDELRRWAVAYLIKNRSCTLEAMLGASLERKYSGNPWEKFFTGGGLHTFQNFDKRDDQRIISVREGLLHSVNLVFIRLMRDVVRYHMYNNTGLVPGGEVLNDPNQRNTVLAKFADYEGATYLRKFYNQYKNKSQDDVLGTLFQSIRPVPRRIAAAYRYLFPEKDLDAFERFMKEQMPKASLTRASLEKMYNGVLKGSLSISDAGFTAGVHPLELWIAGYMQKYPIAAWQEIREQARPFFLESYAWLFRTANKSAQERSIGVILEREAFKEIHSRWKRLGYSFDTLVPSYATSIGSSGDSPAALASLMGILLNDGIRRPSHLIEEIRLGAETPYETQFRLEPPAGERVIAPEIAQVVKETLYDVVRVGTAVRLNRAFVREDGTEITIGGKTGTGDHRYKTFDSSGKMIGSKAMHRTATFTFIFGDRFFGDISAYVLGPASDDYRFTSSLPLAVLKLLSPILVDLESRQPDADAYSVLSSL
ncbi:MAG: glycosyl transferase family 51 [Desulfobacteraceae bacterium]|nr:MAG: glycosyl transferase family 51 [Desulfobacteraceae bacterium]